MTMSDFHNIRSLNVVHFTHGATDPLYGHRSHGVNIVLIADGGGADETYVSCLHFEPGGWVMDPPVGRDSVILVVHGEVTLDERCPSLIRHCLSPGVGLVLSADTPHRMESQTGAILIVVEAERLQATESGISTPDRIFGQLWPGETLDEKPRTLLSICRSIYWRRWKWRKLYAPTRVDRSGWRAWDARGIRRFLLGLARKGGR